MFIQDEYHLHSGFLDQLRNIPISMTNDRQGFVIYPILLLEPKNSEGYSIFKINFSMTKYSIKLVFVYFDFKEFQ